LREKPDGVAALIAQGESDTLEFKSSARWDTKENRQNPVMEKVIVKTVAGFLNYEKGGTLLIGVADDGTILGLDHDLQTLKNKPNLDGYELFLHNLLLGAYGKDSGQFIHISFPVTGGKTVCRIDVKPSARPVFVKDEKGQQFYARVGNQTVPMSMEEAWNYCRVRWK
jgi:predicted HTH transcriptional regulator